LAGSKKEDKGGDSGDASKKADFSAYWSMRVREFFSSRRNYLEGGAQQTEPEKPRLLQWMDDQVDAWREVEAQRKASGPPEDAVAEALERAADAEAVRMTRPLEQALLGKELPSDLRTDPVSVEKRRVRRAV
jgi:hypothetical protein